MTNLYFMSCPRPDWTILAGQNFRSEMVGKTRERVDPLMARQEWLNLATAIEDTGAKVVVLDSPDKLLTGMPYAAEAGQFVPGENAGDPARFILARMGKPHRVGESAHWKALMEKLNIETIELPGGVWEGQGDVAWFDGATILFYGGRTTGEGMMHALEYFDGDVITVQVKDPAFHGNMALLPLHGINKMLVCPEVIVGDGLKRLEWRFGKERIIEVTLDEIKNYATNGLPIGLSLLAPHIMPERPKTLLTDLGMQIAVMDMGEICAKGGGASRCLVCHWPDAPDLVIPWENSLGYFEQIIVAES